MPVSAPEAPAARIEFPPELIDAIASAVIKRLEDRPRDSAPWIDKRQLAAELRCSVRWIEDRLRDGMPSAMIAGRRKFLRAEVERWLESAGHIEPRQ